MGFMKDVEVKAEPKRILYQQEVDALYAVMGIVIDKHLALHPQKGTFILDGQPYGDAAQLITKFHFVDGPYTRQITNESERTSDEMAADSINALLAWPHEESRFYHFLFNNLDEKRTVNGVSLPRGNIYRDCELVVLALNCKYGRFLASAKARNVDDEECYWECGLLLLTLAVAFAQMCSDDTDLIESALEVQFAVWDFYRVYNPSETQLVKDVILTVQQAFNECADPALQAWREWHETAIQSGELGYFFQ